MQAKHALLFQLFKYSVYLLLGMNVYWFFAEELSAARVQFPGGVPWTDFIAAYAATIDTAAWVFLLLMFELETCVLDDRHFTRRLTRTLQGIRVLCYTVIVYAFYGYAAKLAFLNGMQPVAGIVDLCALVPAGWSYAVDLDEYVRMTAANCSSFAATDDIFHLPGMPVAVDAAGRIDILRLAAVDVLNAGVWLLVVLILEVDVHLQERQRYTGLALQLSNAFKVVLYSLLLLAAIYWGVKGDFVDFWDAFLWLLAFVFIEMNIFEWRQETEAQSA